MSKKKIKENTQRNSRQILEYQQKRQYLNLMRDLQQQYIKDRKKELKRKKIEKMIAKQAEED